MALRHFVGYALGMETSELKQVLDARDRAKGKEQTERALVVTFAIIPGCVIALLLVIRFVQNL